jgi:hypothetical protein
VDDSPHLAGGLFPLAGLWAGRAGPRPLPYRLCRRLALSGQWPSATPTNDRLFVHLEFVHSKTGSDLLARCRVPFWTGNSGSKPPSLAIQTAIAPEKGRFALESWTARKAAIHDASNPPGSRWGATDGTGTASSARWVLVGVAPPSGRPPGRGAHTEARDKRPCQRPTSTSNPNFPSNAALFQSNGVVSAPMRTCEVIGTNRCHFGPMRNATNARTAAPPRS